MTDVFFIKPKRGTLWKTSWRRQRPSIGTAPQDVWWFANFGDAETGADESYYQQPLVSPSIGETVPPFWIGAIFGSSLPAADLGTAITRGFPAPLPTVPSWTARLDYEFFPPPSPSDLSPLEVTAFAAPSPGAELVSGALPHLGGSASPPLVRAVVVMLVVEPAPSGPGFQQSLWVDGALRAQGVSAVAYNPYIGGLLHVRPKFGFLNSMAGGNALPTTQEIQDWFQQSRYATPFPAAQQIPGKTLDQYDAASTPAVVPNPLVNLAGGQNAPLLSVGAPPVPVNILVPTTFGY